MKIGIVTSNNKVFSSYKKTGVEFIHISSVNDLTKVSSSLDKVLFGRDFTTMINFNSIHSLLGRIMKLDKNNHFVK